MWIEDGTSLAVVHGPKGFYALDLSDVPQCPVDIREGEGLHIDKPSMDTVLTCADGSVRARFDRYGRSVAGRRSPNRPPLAARKVISLSGGTLLVFHRRPDRPIRAYWPPRPLALPSTVDDAAHAFFDAWGEHDRRAAKAIASAQAVDEIFGWKQTDFRVTDCTPRYCWFRDESGGTPFALTVKNTGHGYWIKRADIGTIEKGGPPD